MKGSCINSILRYFKTSICYRDMRSIKVESGGHGFGIYLAYSDLPTGCVLEKTSICIKGIRCINIIGSGSGGVERRNDHLRTPVQTSAYGPPS